MSQIDKVIFIREYDTDNFRKEMREHVDAIKAQDLDAEFHYQTGFEDVNNCGDKKYAIYTCLIIVRKVQ